MSLIYAELADKSHYFIVFHICKVGVGFTSPSKPMCHLFENNAPHIKL
jgi:hypothetical protein